MLKFYKCRNVKSPSNAYDGSAGYDFFIPEDLTNDIIEAKNPHNIKNSDFTTDSDYFYREPNELIKTIEIQPHGSILIPSGIHVNFPGGHALIAFNKSGVATKKRLCALGCVIDENYQGEVHISLVNTSNEVQKISAGEKILQFILMKINVEKLEEIKSLKELYPIKSARSVGGFGSSGDF